jgi:hypothetical protein
MYSKLTIRNFRCFKELKIEGLKRINLITGMNDVGKTSCLEALFLLIGGYNPALPLKLNVLRGLGGITPNSQEQWGWLFYNRDTAHAIEIFGSLAERGEDALRIHLGSRKEFELLSKGEQELRANVSGTRADLKPSAELPATTISVEPSDLILDFSEHRGRSLVSRVSIGADGSITTEQPKKNEFRPGVFLASGTRRAAEDADRFSQLKISKRDSEVVGVLRAIEPDIRDLTILVRGGESIIHADVAGVGLVPMPMLGEGVGRLMSLTLAILATKAGLVLVDEIENGLHHSVLPKIWKGLGVAATRAETQLVATTHSAECLRAAHQAFSENSEYPLSVIQLFRLPDGVQGRVLDRKQIEAAIAGDIDLR